MEYVYFTLMAPVALVVGVLFFVVRKDPTKLSQIGEAFRPIHTMRRIS